MYIYTSKTNFLKYLFIKAALKFDLLVCALLFLIGINTFFTGLFFNET
ncbi:hypothetical protein PSM_A0435 [Pseudoalteromonas sp. SM9913]|nr:hypothetical protein PSM_A0435 [Pseudoalteromonas sp. SM9913]